MTKISINLFFVLFTCAFCTQIALKQEGAQTVFAPSTEFGDTYDKVMKFLSTGVRVLMLYTEPRALDKTHTPEYTAMLALAGKYGRAAKFRLVTWLISPDLQKVFNQFQVGTDTALTYIIYNNGAQVAKIKTDIYKVERIVDKLVPA